MKEIPEKDLAILLAAASKADPDPAFVERLAGRLRGFSAAPAPPSGARGRRLRRFALAAAAAVLVLVPVLYLRHSGTRAEVPPSRRIGPPPASPGLKVYEPIRPVGITGRLAFGAWVVGGKVIEASSIPDGPSLARLDSLEIFVAPPGAAPVPTHWGSSGDDGSNSLNTSIKVGRWAVVVAGPDGRILQAVETPEMVAFFTDQKACSEFGRRVKAVHDKDPSMAAALLRELKGGAGKRPWSSQADLIADIAAVGGRPTRPLLAVKAEEGKSGFVAPLRPSEIHLDNGCDLAIAARVISVEEFAVLEVDEIFIGDLADSTLLTPREGRIADGELVGPCPFEVGMRGIFLLRNGGVVAFTSKSADEAYLAERNKIRGYVNGAGVADLLEKGESMAFDVPGARTPTGVRAIIEHLKKKPASPLADRALKTLAAAGGYEAESFLAEAAGGKIAGVDAKAAAESFRKALARDVAVKPPERLALGAVPRQVQESGNISPSRARGIIGRLRISAWVVGGRVAETREDKREAVLDHVEMYVVPSGARDVPEAWGAATYSSDGRDGERYTYKAGTWVVMCATANGDLSEKVEPDDLVALLPDGKSCWQMATRIRAVRERDPALAPVLAEELKKGGGSLPWTTPEDLIADLAMVGGPEEVKAVREWGARKAGWPVEQKFAEESADRMEMASAARAALSREIEREIGKMRDASWDVREAASAGIVEWTLGLGRTERAWVRKALEERASSEADVEAATRLKGALEVISRWIPVPRPDPPKGLDALGEKTKADDEAQATWKALDAGMVAGSLKDGYAYEGKEVRFDGAMTGRGNPIVVSFGGAWTARVRLREEEVKSVSDYPADNVVVKVRGRVKSVDVKAKVVEVESMRTAVHAAE